MPIAAPFPVTLYRAKERLMPRNEGGGGDVLLAFLLGAAAGAAIALLFAPATGEETRNFLSEKAREGRDKAAEAARQGRDILNRQRDNLNAAMEKGREAYQQARQPRETV
jgi:gas vesicle protein